MPDEPPKSARAQCDNTAGLTPEELAETKRYARWDLACTLADKGLDVAYLSVMAFLLAQPIDSWLKTFALLEANWSLRLAAMFLVVTGVHVCVSFPLLYFSGFVLEHRFGLSTLTFGGWLWRWAKRMLLALALGLGLFLGLYWLIWTTGAYWWLLATGGFFCVSILIGRLTPVLILPLFYRIEQLDDPQLVDRIARLAEGTGLSIGGVYRMGISEETVKANAMLAGLGRTRRVLLGDTLLDSFTPEEIEVIFAHEIGHHVFGHLRKLIAAGFVYSAAGFWACDRLLSASIPDFRDDYAHLPVATMPLVMLILTLFAMLLEPLQNFVSRRFERQSDRYALQRTGLKGAYLSAFRKLARLNKDDPHPNRLDVLLFHSHPPVAERLATAEEDLE